MGGWAMAPGVEFGDLKWIAIAAAMASNIVLGFLWYSQKTPTGRLWMKHMGFPKDHKPKPGEMMRAMILMVIGTFLLMFVLQHNFIAYRDAYGIDQMPVNKEYDLSMMDGFMGGFFTWLGFFVPVQLGSISWEGKPWSLFFVNAGYYLVSLVAARLIYAAFV
jgi:fluoride ion exporter CrcB/FEX